MHQARFWRRLCRGSLSTFETNLDQFSRHALAKRKRDGLSRDPEWLADYLEKAHYPTLHDVERLKAKIAEYREIYERAIKPARNKYIAHRAKVNPVEVQELFSNGKVGDLWRLVTFLYSLHTALWEQYHNGRRPLLSPRRYSLKAIYASGPQSDAPHELVVADIKKLMGLLEHATFNA